MRSTWLPAGSTPTTLPTGSEADSPTTTEATSTLADATSPLATPPNSPPDVKEGTVLLCSPTGSSSTEAGTSPLSGAGPLGPSGASNRSICSSRFRRSTWNPFLMSLIHCSARRFSSATNCRSLSRACSCSRLRASSARWRSSSAVTSASRTSFARAVLCALSSCSAVCPALTASCNRWTSSSFAVRSAASSASSSWTLAFSWSVSIAALDRVTRT